LGCGSTFLGTANSWQAGNFYAPTGATSVVGTSSATFYITGVQLEVGSYATGFDYRPYGTELTLCQRYCFSIAPTATFTYSLTTGLAYTTVNVAGILAFPITMRATPTITFGTQTDYQVTNGSGAAIATTSVGGAFTSPQSVELGFVVAAGLTAGQASVMRIGNAGTGKFIASAEL
jgi:hypothetical protein